MTKLFLALLLSALVCGAAELTGKWSGSFDITDSSGGETKADSAFMDLKAQDGVVTGTAGPNADKQWSLRNGKLDGQKLTFEVVSEDGGVLNFHLTFDGETIEGTCEGTGNGGEKLSAKLRLKRST
jgi:hypothetical protein